VATRLPWRDETLLPAAGRHLGFAKALVHEMPHTLRALEFGTLSEWRAPLIFRESACLDIEDRRTLDAELCGDPASLDVMGDARVAAAAKAIAYRLDPHARRRPGGQGRERTQRSPFVPAPDTMTYLTALLPVAQGVSVYAALRREADTRSDGRSRGQVMADTLVERVTRPRRGGSRQPIAVNLVLSDETLLGGDSAPADICGYGPIHAAVARAWWRAPSSIDGPGRRCAGSTATLGPERLVSLESRARLFPRGLTSFIEMRDQRCRTPYWRRADPTPRPCINPWAEGGPTTANKRARVMRALQPTPGSRRLAGQHEHRRKPHAPQLEFTTPTGRQYGLEPRRGGPAITVSDLEVRIGIAIARHAA